MENMIGWICWECSHILEKFLKFKRQVSEAQEIIKTTQKIDELISLSPLLCQTKYFFDKVYYYTPDPLTNSLTDEKIEAHFIKVEDVCESLDNKSDFNDTCIDNEEKTNKTESVYVETLENILITKVKKKHDYVYRNTDKKSDIDDTCLDCDEKTNLTESIYIKTLKNKISKRGKKKQDIPKNLNNENEIYDTIDSNKKPEKDLKCKKFKKAKKQNIDSIDSKIDLKNPEHVRKDVTKNKNDETSEKSKTKTIRNKNPKVINEINDTSELIEKFTTVVYTEEEMMKKRDEKRNQPNFKKIPYKCDLCVLGFTKKETYDEHLEKKHNENIGPLKCDVCHVRFTTDKRLSRHRRQHYTCYRCKFCPYRTCQLRPALAHCRTKHGADTSGSVHCPQCDAVASTPEELAEHKRTKHTVVCNDCGEKFKGRNTLRTHMIRIHGAKRQFICDVCSKSFKSRSRLESHMSRHSAALASRLAYCVSCRVQYKNIHVYRNHLRNSAHHADTQYPCPECDKKFASKVYWTKHYNFYHLRKSQYNCGICNKLFISDWRLKNHKQKHHGLSRSRDHSCNTCGKKFYTVSTLRGHELTHSTQRTYMCEDCGDTFKQRPALYTHARLLHRDKRQ